MLQPRVAYTTDSVFGDCTVKKDGAKVLVTMTCAMDARRRLGFRDVAVLTSPGSNALRSPQKFFHNIGQLLTVERFFSPSTEYNVAGHHP